MARLTIRSTTEKIYFLILTGLLLFNQVIPVYSNVIQVRRSKMRNDIQLENRTERTVRQVYDTWTKQDEDRWKTSSLNNRKIYSTEYYNESGINYNAPSQKINDEGRIIFPDDDFLHESSKPKGPRCANSVICDDVPDYPTNIIKRQLEKNENFQYMQVKDEIEQISNRIGDSDDHPLCLSKVEVVFPLSGETLSNGYMYIANTNNFQQGVRVEICKNKDQPCKLINNFASGYKTVCEQKYTYRRLVGAHSDGQLSQENFRVPSSCCCKVKFVGDPWQRIGLGGKNSRQISRIE